VASEMLAPICALLLLPQHTAEPFARRPHAWLLPHVRLVRGAASATGRGVPELAGARAPTPSCPTLLEPQQKARPLDARSPHAKLEPTHTEAHVKPAATGVAVGTDAAAVTPFASTPLLCSPHPYSAPEPLRARVKLAPANTRTRPSAAVPAAATGSVPAAPVPHAPHAHSPAHTTRPASVSAQSCVCPMDTAANWSPADMPTAGATELAVGLLMAPLVFVNRRPELRAPMLPQQYIALAASMPQEEALPEAIVFQWLPAGEEGTATGGHRAPPGITSSAPAPRPMRGVCAPQHSHAPAAPPNWPHE
jgi:hypothetical protein